MKAGGKLKILIAIIIFSAIILIHELGHFLLAKLNGISVTEFSLGMGPRLFSVQKGETRYSVKLLPLGGSCAMVGEDTAEEELPGSFNAAPVWGRISVVAAGPVFNFILAFILSVIIVGFVGYDPAEIVEVQQDSAASEAGLEAGDVITAINGTEVADGEAYDAYLQEHPLSDEPVEITYVRDGLDYTATITPQEYRTPVLGFSYNLGYQKANGLEVLKYGTLEVKYMIRTTLLSLKQLVTGGLGFKDLSGPVGVVDAIGTTYEESKSEGALMLWMNMLNMAVLLSANLGVMNLLPLPALDGGRLVFLIVEAVRRKPINREVEGMVHFAGLMLLMALMVVVMYNDILKIF